MRIGSSQRDRIETRVEAVDPRAIAAMIALMVGASWACIGAFISIVVL